MFFLFSSCAKYPSDKICTQKNIQNPPLWFTNPEILNDFEAIGYSPPNFHGMQIQREQALAQARTILIQRISSLMNVDLKNMTKQSKVSVANRYTINIRNFSRNVLVNSYQADAYIDERGGLYLLVRLHQSIKKTRPLQSLKTTPFSIKPLLQRRCYAKEKLLTIKTKSPLYNGKPIWFYRPNSNEIKMRALGIAEKMQNSTLYSQKKIAMIFAKASLVKQKAIYINSLDEIFNIVVHEELGEEENWQISTKTVSKIGDIKLLDIWMDPEQCELYVWVEKE